MSSLKFGTSGLRGLVVDLVGGPAHGWAAAFLHALGDDLAPGSDVPVGRDLRSSSPAIAADVMAAVRDAGFRPLDCGALPTPALALEALRRDVPAVMVTGSHIPDDRNGLKFYTGAGEITKRDEAAIVAAHRSGPAARRDDAMPEPGEPCPAALDRYRERCVAALPAGALAGLTVGVFQQSTVARDLLVEVIEALGGEARPFGRASTFVPVDTEAHRPEDLAAIRDAARAGGLDAVVTADGDGDRPLVADAAGRVLPGDVVGTLAARHLGVRTVAVPVTAGSALEAAGGFERVLRTRVGSPFVIAGMEDATAAGATAVAGFESNGGFLLGSELTSGGRRIAALPTRDAILPIVATLAAARAAGVSLAELAAGLGFRATAAHRLQDVPAERSGAFLDGLRDAAGRAAFLAPLGAGEGFDDVDGVRLRLDRGRVIHFRASGNAPELRCYAEAGDPDEAERIVGWGLAAAAAAMDGHDG